MEDALLDTLKPMSEAIISSKTIVLPRIFDSLEILVIVFGVLFLVFLVCVIKILLEIFKLKKENEKMSNISNEAKQALQKLLGYMATNENKIKSLEERVGELIEFKKKAEQIIDKFLEANPKSEQKTTEERDAANVEHCKPLDTSFNTDLGQDMYPQISTSEIPKEDKDIFFLPSPTAEGFFSKEHIRTEFEKNTSLYRFERKPGSNKANVFVAEDESVVAIFTNNPDVQNGACEIQGRNYAKAIKIKTDEHGIALLEGDKWRIDKKVKISYIVN
jgi:hypothetical protein